MVFDLLERRRQAFVLWIPANSQGSNVPQLIIGKYDPQAQDSFSQSFKGPLEPAGIQDLWQLSPKAIKPSLNDGVYHYWFEIQDTSPSNSGVIQVTDPLAHTVDARLVKGNTVQYASVIKYRDGGLWACDVDGTEVPPPQLTPLSSLPANNNMVIYELPISWAKAGTDGVVVFDEGTVADVLALFDAKEPGQNFKDVPAVSNGAIVKELGINGLELLPITDTQFADAWGYAPKNYQALKHDFGTTSELGKLADLIHSQNTRLITDVVMAFGYDPYIYLAYKQFHLDPHSEPQNADSYQSHNPSHQMRDGFGGTLWRYILGTTTYNPETGNVEQVTPSWAFHKGHLTRWMTDLDVNGLRLDSVNNIGSWDFVRSYKDKARALFNARYPDADPSERDAKFLVVGEELSMPFEMVTEGYLDALWNEDWQSRLRSVIIGQGAKGDNFEWTVRKMANCTLAGFTDGAQAVNYITSHDVEGFAKERLYNYLQNNKIVDMEQRAKMTFALFLTAVGIPMIFAGEEFLDQMDTSTPDVAVGQAYDKQHDPVNYSRKSDDWRTRIFNYVANLVKFRKTCPALGVDDTNFIHVDTSRDAKIMAWTRGGVVAGQAPVVVVANFTDYDTPGPVYDVSNWPDQDRDDWREITQNRAVPQEWVGKEPLMQWEVKIYTYGSVPS